MKKEIEKRLTGLKEEVEKHIKDYEILPQVIAQKQGAIIELKKLIGIKDGGK